MTGTPADVVERRSLETALTARMRDAQAKARVLREALPWMTRWAGRTVVVKYGGNALAGGGDGAGSFASDVALLHSVGLRVVVVHGGGPQISDLSTRLGLESAFVDGRRVTDAPTLEIVKMVLLGQVNPTLVGAITAAGATAVGVAGTDGTLLTARPADPRLGLVGDVERINPRVLVSLLDEGAVPVVAPLGRDAGGAEYNVNADAAAGAVATALRADKLIFLTNVPGLYEDFGAGDARPLLLSHVTLERLRSMLGSGALHTGMVPKIASVVAALDGGVAHAHLLDGRVEHALLLEIFTDEGIGTMVDKETT
ncbi:MAG: acetylglutamate kinase [Nitriliruptorales bacterium]|nr:acetylglutamate kinase [Nitriliruptorales bacterium]